MRSMSAVRVAWRLVRGVAPTWSRITNSRSVRCAELKRIGQFNIASRAEAAFDQQLGTDWNGKNALFTLSLSKKGEVDFEYGLEEGHVCSLVKTDLESDRFKSSPAAKIDSSDPVQSLT